MSAPNLRLLIFNLATDQSDPLLAFTTNWVRALAERSATVQVITMREGRHDLPPNVTVRSLGKEKGYSEPRRLLEFYRHTRTAVREGVDVCFSHMTPLFTILGAPLLRLHGIPTVTWFTHPHLSHQLRAAHWLSDRMVSSLESSYPYRTDKLTVTGHGIDTQRFRPDPARSDDPPLVLYVGRLSPAKDVATLIKATAVMRDRCPRPFQVGIVGGPAVPSDEAYVGHLHAEVDRLDLLNHVWFQPYVPFYQLPNWYQRASVFVNLSPLGFGDKVAWEAMACGIPCVLANPGVSDTLGPFADDLLFAHGDPEQLAERLDSLLARPREERSEIGLYLRSRVIRLHDFDRLGDQLIQLFTEVCSTDARSLKFDRERS